MSNPRELMNRIQRRGGSLPPARRQVRVPAPVPVGQATSAPPQSAPTQQATQSDPVPAPQPAPSRPTTARPAGSHALYSAVMRSHDRMGTRHL